MSRNAGTSSVSVRFGIVLWILVFAVLTTAGDTAAVRYITWVGGESKALEDEVIDMFRRKRPDIPVAFDSIPGSSRTLPEYIYLSLAGGVNIDISLTHTRWLQSFIDQGFALDLSSYIKRDRIDLTKYPAAVMQSFTGPGGEVYAFPMQWTTIVLAYNKDFMDRRGMEYPSNDWTIFDMQQTAKKLSAWGADGQIEARGLGFENLHEYVWRLWDVPFTNEDMTQSGWSDPRTIEAWQWYVDLHRETAVGNMNDFINGQLGMRLSWPHSLIAAAPTMTHAWDIALHPIGAVGERVCRGAGAQWIIFTNSANRENAWELMKFLVSHEAQLGFLVRGRGGVHIPAMAEYWRRFDFAKSGISNPRTLQNRSNIFEAYAYASLDRQPAIYEDLLRTVVMPLASDLAAGKTAVKTAVAEATRRINALLAGSDR